MSSLGATIASSCSDVAVINTFTEKCNLKFILFPVIGKYCSLSDENEGESGSGWFFKKEFIWRINMHNKLLKIDFSKIK